VTENDGPELKGRKGWKKGGGRGVTVQAGRREREFLFKSLKGNKNDEDEGGEGRAET